MNETISRLQVTVNNTRIKYNAYFTGCMKKSSCKKIINASPSEIFNTVYFHEYYDLENTAMTNSNWAKAIKEVDAIYKISQGPLDTADYFKLVQEFYSIYSSKEIARLTQLKTEKFAEL